MFVFFFIVFGIALLSFGAVQPHWYLLLGLVSFGGACLLFFSELRQKGRIPAEILIWLLALATAILLVPRFALTVFAFGWIWTVAQRTPLKILGLFNVLIAIGLGEALLGLVQYFVLPGWIFGYQNVAYISSGTLINHNHFAGLLEMIIPSTVGMAYIWAHRTRDVFHTYFYLLIGAIITLALIFSTSRMGIFAGLSTLIILGSILRYKHATKAATLLVLGLVVIVVAGALWIGIDVVIDRYAQLGTPDAVVHEGRFLIFRDTIKLIRANPWGIGVGKYQDIFRQYQTWRMDLLVDHAHNDYLETIAEWGILPAATFWIAAVVVLARGVHRFMKTQSVERAGILVASSGAVLSILIHSLADFNLQIPANGMLFCAHLGILAAISSRVHIPPLTQD